MIKTGIPFEFGSSDAYDYHELAAWLNEIGWKDLRSYMSTVGISDSGYPIYLTLLYAIVGPNILVARVVKSLLSAWMCVMMYNIATRNFGEKVGRMAGIFGCLMPNLVIYCGLHLKEVEMIFLAVATLDRADNMLHKNKIFFWDGVIVVLLIASLFFFRTVLGATVAFAIFTSIVFSRSRAVTSWNRAVLIIWAVMAVGIFAGGTIASDVRSVWEQRTTNQDAKRSHQVNKGVKWAKYATGSVMAPMMFVLPFPTMIDVDEQYNQQLINGGNYVRNFLGIFVIITTFDAIFRRKNWRDFTLIGSYPIAYLGVVCSSGFANAERFLLPALPMLLIMAAYGISILSAKNFRYVKIWYVALPIIIIGWAVFKLGSRGIL
ncbi:MAG: hypothetical protein MJZ86_04360 [Bacteroidales bacterium]|nr:hypothetical protein [Bacteroidales bacterium]